MPMPLLLTGLGSSWSDQKALAQQILNLQLAKNMQIIQIHSMFWGDQNNTLVGLIADTDEGANQLIGTPYSEASIIWDAIKVFPVDQIAAYTPPTTVS